MSSSANRNKQSGAKKKSLQRTQPATPQSKSGAPRAAQPTPQGQQATSSTRADSRRAQRVIQAQRNKRRRQLMIIGGGIGIGLLAVLTLVVINLSGGSSLEAVAAAPAKTTDAPRDGNSIGAADAPVTVVEWGDYQCPACEYFWQTGQDPLMNTYVATGKVRFQFRDYAFLGQESIDAAIAATCADKQAKFWEYHDMLYYNQQGENKGAFSKSRLKEMAELLGLDMDAFNTCMNDDAVADSVSQSLQDGRAAGVNSTPTFIVNGTDVVTGGTWSNLQQAIDAALANQ